MDKMTMYLKDVYNELLYKVSWPTWEELQNSAVVVLIASLLIAFAVFLMDFLFGANPENSWFQGVLYWLYRIFN